MLLTSLNIATDDFAAATGWQLKAEGACKGEVCVPLREAPGETVDITRVAEDLAMPLVGEPGLALWALGPESIGSRALTTAAAPDLSLPDLNGNLLQLSSLKGQKIVVFAWAPY